MEQQPLRSRQLARRFSALTLAALWASGSSYVLFVVAARSLTVPDLGRLAAMLAGLQLLTYLSDLGLTGLLVREVVRTGTLSILRWSLRRRVLVVVVVAPLINGVAGRWDDVATLLLLVAAGMTNATYSALVAVRFALGDEHRVGALQALNGVAFVVAALGAAAVEPTSRGFLAAIAIAYTSVLVLEFSLLSNALRAPRQAPAWRGQVPFMVSGVAFGIASTADSLLLSTRSAVWVAEYAGAQRAAMGVGVATRTAGGMLLPRFTRSPREFPVTRLTLLFVLLLALGACAGLLARPLVNLLYGENLVSPAVMALVLGAYAADLLLVTTSVNLLAKGRERGLAVVACAQAATIVLLAAALLDQGPVGVAAALVLGRCVGFAGQLVLERRSV